MGWDGLEEGKEKGKETFYVNTREGQPMCCCWTKQMKPEKHKDVEVFKLVENTQNVNVKLALL